MWKAISKQWFLLALAASLAVGFGIPDLVRPLAQNAWVRSALTASVLFLMGLTFDTGAVSRSLRRPMPSLLSIGLSTVLVPLLALPSLWLLSTDLAGGLIVTAIVPCTLASAAVWTRKAGGDDAVAMIVSIVTNLACFLVAPVGLWLILGQVTEISARDQITTLALWVVLPLVVGQGLRRLLLEGWAAGHQKQLSTVAQLGILVMVMFGSVASADRLGGTGDDNATAAAIEILTAGAMALAVHVAALTIAIAAAARLGATPQEQIAVGFSASQKTLMVGLQIALDTGVSVLPMIIYHVGQLMIDTVVAQRWSARHHAGTPGGQAAATGEENLAAIDDSGTAMP